MTFFFFLPWPILMLASMLYKLLIIESNRTSVHLLTLR